VSTAELSLSVDVAAPPAVIFAAMTDWDRQSEWMLGTSVSVVSGDGRSAGSELVASTCGIADRMRITRWEEPHVVEVLHLGTVVRGTGVFEVRGSRFLWTERLTVPFGFPLVRPVVVAGLRYSLRRFARFAEGHR